MRTSGEKFISSLHCVAKKEKSKRVPELGGRELTDLSPDVLTAYTMAGPLSSWCPCIFWFLEAMDEARLEAFEGRYLFKKPDTRELEQRAGGNKTQQYLP